ncbi:MAG: hypothetical protein LBL96_09810 [Clostridiales bacterium]|nr:hypothetical protein [Clostridiales bacterium]
MTTAFTALLMIAVFVTGTYAWNNPGVDKTALEITASGTSSGASSDTDDDGATLHIDTNKDENIIDIYIENWGKSAVAARLQIREYAESGSDAAPFISAAELDDIDTWNTHIPKTTSNSDIDDCNKGAAKKFHTYWKWEVTGTSKNYYPAPADNRADKTFIDTDNTKGTIDVSTKETPTVKDVITIKSWQNKDEPIDSYWVYDSDGWVYWAKPIASGSATGVLRIKVTQAANPNGEYYYGLNIETQMGTEDGGDDNSYLIFSKKDNGSWTTDAKTLCEALWSK